MTQAERDRLARETRDEVKSMKLMLTGNGNPKSGMAWQLADLQRDKEHRDHRSRRRDGVLWAAIIALACHVAVTGFDWIVGGTPAQGAEVRRAAP